MTLVDDTINASAQTKEPLRSFARRIETVTPESSEYGFYEDLYLASVVPSIEDDEDFVPFEYKSSRPRAL